MSNPMDPCPGCEARKSEVEYLRTQVKDLQAQVLAISSPSAFAQVTGKTVMPQGDAIAHHTDENGETWVVLEGTSVRLDEYKKFLAGRGGFFDNDGKWIPQDEWERVAARLAEDMAPPADPSGAA